MRRRSRLLLLSVAALGRALLLLARCATLPPIPPPRPAAELAAAGFSAGTAEALGRAVHWIAAGRGAGPAVLFVHGSPGDWRAYESLLADPGLRAAARLVAFDRPGFGATGGGALPRLADQAAVAALVLASAAPGARAVVVGHSLGGPIAARLAVDRPDLVAGLLLVAPSIDPALERHRWYNVAGAMRVVQWFLPREWIASNREIWPLRAELADMAPRLAGLRVPATVIQGTEDDLVDPGNAAFVARAMTGTPVRRVDVPQEGHFVLWTRGDLVRAEIGRLLDAAAPEPGAAPGSRAER